MEFFPLGVWHYLVGGLLIGAGVAFIFLTTGLRAGASSFFTTTISWISRLAYFQREPMRGSRDWRLVFSIGLVVGAVLFTLTLNEGRSFVTEVQVWRLALGGFLVGLGTRVSRGCTSGHGICGLASGSPPSLAAVATFMGVAIVVAQLVRVAGVAP